MSIKGRPMRFILVVLGGWTALRLSMVLPFASEPTGGSVSQATKSPVVIAAQVAPAVRIPAARPLTPAIRFLLPRLDASTTRPTLARSKPTTGPPASSSDPAVTSAQATSASTSPSGTGLSATGIGLPRPAPSPDRWSGAAWALWRRGGGGAGYAFGPRLGASQAGVRLDYALAPTSPLRPVVYARASSALEGEAAAEVAAGIGIRPPLPLPVILAVERRQRVSPGGRSAFAILAAGGVAPVELGHGFRLDAYAQAGMVGFRSRDAFVDGRITVERPVAEAPALAMGAAIWGGAQPGVSRLDIGPQLSARVRIADRTLRLGAEWRQRVAGNAAPSSGPALSLGTDF